MVGTAARKHEHHVAFTQELLVYGRTYGLTGVVCHKGKAISSGHYTGYISVQDAVLGRMKWYRVDDTPPTCTGVLWAEVAANAQVYMLWYTLTPHAQVAV